jgi:positive regulator of sigma E activity
MIFLAWFAPLLFMLVAFYVLFNSGAPMAAKIVFTAVPVAIWILGGFAIHREYRERNEEKIRQDEVLNEAKRILDDFAGNRKHPDTGRDRSHQEERHD